MEEEVPGSSNGEGVQRVKAMGSPFCPPFSCVLDCKDLGVKVDLAKKGHKTHDQWIRNGDDLE